MLIEQLETRQVLAAMISSTSFGSKGTLPTGATSITVTFSEPVVGAADAASYELRRAGVDGLLGNTDDPSIAITSASYASGTNTVTINFVEIIEDVYRLIIKDSVKDGAGNALDGDGDNLPGGNGRRDFVVTNPEFVANSFGDVLLDQTFGPNGIVTTEFFNFPNTNDYARGVTVQDDGKIVAVGANSAVRYHSSGALDTSFGIAGKAIFSGIATSVAIQSDGKIVVAGYGTTTSGNYDFVVARYNANGTPDPTFDGDGKVIAVFGTTDDVANGVAIQSDGKIVVAGYSGNDYALLRYNVNGSLDATFDGDGKLTTHIGGTDRATSVAVQSDGKILVAGTSENGQNYDFSLARYNTDGTLDATFDGDGKLTTAIGTSNDSAYSLAIQSDGKIVVVGLSSNLSTLDFALARYNANGSLDSTFDGDGKLITTNFGFARSVAIQSDGKIVVAGNSAGGLNEFALARYNVDGSLDTTFDGDGKLYTTIGTSRDSTANSVAVQSDGKIVVAGVTRQMISNDFALARYNMNGSLDTGFDGDGILTTDIATSTDAAQSIAIQSDGKIVVAGSSRGPSFNNHFALARYNLDGSLDTTFDGDGKVLTDFGKSAIATSVAIQNDGKIVVAGIASDRGVNYLTLARYNANGSLDTTFDGDGKLITTFGASFNRATSLAIQSDGKIVIAGASLVESNDDFAVMRFNTNGSLDTTFDGDGVITADIGATTDLANAMALQSDGKIVVAGTSNGDFALARFDANGSLDTTFDSDGIITTAIGASSDFAYSLAIQSDGKILAAGSSNNFLNNDFALVRYNANGSLDTTFDGDGILTTAIGKSDDAAYSVAIQNNDKIVVAGISMDSINENFAVARYNVDGSLDRTFDRDGKLTADLETLNDTVRSVAIQSDGKIVVAGSIRHESDNDFAVVRFDTQNAISQLVSPNEQVFDVDGRGAGMGQLLQGSSNAFDGLNRLMVNGTVYGVATSPTMANGDQTIITPSTSIAGLAVSRKVTVPNTGVQDFARTIDVFANATGSSISVPVQIVGNLGSDAGTTIFATSDGDLIVEPTDLWFATDDSNPTGGTPAIVHLLHGPFGLQPTSVSVNDDNVQWTYNLTVASGETKRIATFTVLGTTRQKAIDAANAMLNSTGFDGQAGAFLSSDELASLANFRFNLAPTGVTFSNIVRPLESANVSTPISVATIRVLDDAFGTNTLGLSGPDASFFTIASGQLRFQSVTKLDFETRPTYVVHVTVDDPKVGATPDAVSTFTLSIADVNEPPTGIQFTNVENSIPESTDIASGVRVAVVKAIDDSLGLNSFSLSGADAAKFILVGQELRLRSNTPLDFETKPSLQVTVEVDDLAIGTNLDASATFTIAVADVNEAPSQVVLESITSQVLESASPTVETPLANITIVDDALGSNSVVLVGPDASLFNLVGKQLRLKAGALLDFETKSTYNVGVRAEDVSISGGSFPETNFRLSVGNRPEVVSIRDVSGGPLGSNVKIIRVAWDSVVDIAPNALLLKKTDLGGTVVPLTFVRSNVSNRTVADLQFSGPMTDAKGLLDGTYVLEADGAKIASGSVLGVNYVSNNINVLTPLLLGKLDIVGPSSVLSGASFGLQFNLEGLSAPPSGNIDYKIDMTGDGSFERTERGPLFFELSNISFPESGSFTVVVTAEKDGITLGKGTKVIDVSPATTLDEDWLLALDTDRDSEISPLDVLVVINRCNTPSRNGTIEYSFSLDVDRDGSISPLDVLSIINYLNQDPLSRKNEFADLFMYNSGDTLGLTNDLSISGQINSNARNLAIMLDGVNKVDASQYVQPDGKFEVNDAAIAQLFGPVFEGAHVVSIATQGGSEFSVAADKRFYRMKSLLQDFQVTSVLKLGNDTRLQWTSSGSGARYSLWAAPTGSTPVKIGSTTSATESRLTLEAGSYDVFVESADGAGNVKRTVTRTIQIV